MSRPKTNKRQKRALDTLQGKGMAAIAIGVGFLLLPMLLRSSPILKPVADGLRVPAWFALGIGAVLLGLHRLLKTKAEADQHQDQVATKSGQRFERESPTPAAAPPMETDWSAKVFAAIEWRRFEAVCESLFAQAGFETRSQSHGADGGVDIWLHSANAQGPAAIVQCKHWQGKPVGVKEIREFLGVMASHQIKRGTYATTSSYTADAKQFAKNNGINTLDGAGLLALIAKRTPEQQQALLAVAYEGEYWRPTCASCGIKLMERKPTKGGAGFWGCSNYPRCKSKLPMVAALR